MEHMKTSTYGTHQNPCNIYPSFPVVRPIYLLPFPRASAAVVKERSVQALMAHNNAERLTLQYPDHASARSSPRPRTC